MFIMLVFQAEGLHRTPGRRETHQEQGEREGTTTEGEGRKVIKVTEVNKAKEVKQVNQINRNKKLNQEKSYDSKINDCNEITMISQMDNKDIVTTEVFPVKLL